MLRRFGVFLARQRDRRHMKSAVDSSDTRNDFQTHASNFRSANKQARPSFGLHAFTRGGLPDDGGARKEVPTTYGLYKKEKFGRQGHPMSMSVSAETRNIPLSDETIESEANESRQLNSQESSFSRNSAGEADVGKSPETYLKGVFSSKSAEQLQKKARNKQNQSLCEDILWKGVTLRDRHGEVATHLKNLRLQKHFRAQRKKVVLHGYKVIMELARHQKVYPKLLITGANQQHNTTKRRQDFIKKLENELKKGGEDTFFVTATNSVMEEIDPANDGFIAEYDMPVESPKELLFASPQQFRNILVLDNITDGGLLGTMMRTASVFGYDLVVFTNHCADIYESSVLTAARGAHFQNITKFVCLSDADGDDESELLNQMIEHHRAQPFLYSPRITKFSPNIRSLSLPGSQRLMINYSLAKAKFLKGERELHMEDPGGILTNRVLHPTRHTSFDRVASAIFISEDKTESFIPKLTNRLRIPSARIVVDASPDFDRLPLSTDLPTEELTETHMETLSREYAPLLQREKASDSPVRKFLHYQSIDVAAPIILHAMRSTELTELLNDEERTVLDSMPQPSQPTQYTTRQLKENIVGDEDIREHHHTMQTQKKERRMRRYQMTDEERWEMNEMQRIKKAHKHFGRFMIQNFDKHTPQVLDSKDPYSYNIASSTDEAAQGQQVAPSSRYPNFIAEKSKGGPITREFLKASAGQGKPMFPSRYSRKHYSRKHRG